MEPIRQQSHAAFITGIVALVLTLALFGFSVYIMPYLVFGWRYEIPAFIVHMVAWLQMDYHFTPGGAEKIVFGLFFCMGLMTALIAHVASNYFDDTVEPAQPINEADTTIVKDETPFYKQEGIRLLAKIMGIIVLVFIGVEVFHWLISSQPT